MPRRPENNAAYMRQYRARKKAAAQAAEAIVTDIGTKRPDGASVVGPVESAVMESCAKMVKAKDQPETVQLAIAMARVVDTGSPTAKVGAGALLAKTMDTLRGGSTSGKLAELRNKVRE